MHQHSRRQILASVGLGAAVAIAGCTGSDDQGTATPDRATPSQPQGDATVAASNPVTGARSANSITSPVGASVSGQQFETLSVAYDDGFDLSNVQGQSATIYVGEGLGTVQTATVADTTVSDDGTVIAFTLDGAITLGEAQQVVAEYGSVRMPASAGEYAVTVTLNDTASETGTVTVERTASRITSTFERTIEGWRVQGDAQGSSAFPNHPESGGNPGRCLEAVDDVQGGTWYWRAPAQFTGEKSAYRGGRLTFDIYQNNRSEQFSNSDVILEGAETTLVYDFGGTDSHPETDWTSYAVPLEPTDAWTVDSLDGEPATGSQFEAVLADVGRLAIRGEYVSGSDTGYLDNPTLVPPE